MRYIPSALFVSACLSLCAAACGRPFDVRTPTGFVELEEPGEEYDYRATSPEGVVVAVRAIEVESGAVPFWEEAIARRLREEEGYALVESKDVRSEDGTKGRELRFGADRGGSAHTYVVTLFRAQGRLFLLEAGGSRELMAKYEPKREWQSKTFRAQCGFLLAPVLASRTCNRW